MLLADVLVVIIAGAGLSRLVLLCVVCHVLMRTVCCCWSAAGCRWRCALLVARCLMRVVHCAVCLPCVVS